MYKLALIVSCLAFLGHGRRTKSSARQWHSLPGNRAVSADTEVDSLNMLTRMLLALRAPEAFNAPGWSIEQSGFRRRFDANQQGALNLRRPQNLAGKQPSPVTMQGFVFEDSNRPSIAENTELVDEMFTEVEEYGYWNGTVKFLGENGAIYIESDLMCAEDVLGAQVNFSSGATGVIITVWSHCQPAVFLAVSTGEALPEPGDIVKIEARFKGYGWNGDPASWSGVYDYLGRPIEAPDTGATVPAEPKEAEPEAEPDAPAISPVSGNWAKERAKALAEAKSKPAESKKQVKMPSWIAPAATKATAQPVIDAVTGQPLIDVFMPVVLPENRRVVRDTLHTGVMALDALVPMGRGQSLLLMSPEDIPQGMKNTDLSNRVLAGQTLETGVRSVLVLNDPDKAKREAKIAALKEAGAFENTRVIVAENEIEALLSFQLASSIAEAIDGEDFLVVIDSFAPLVKFWDEIEEKFEVLGYEWPAEKSSDACRKFYAMFCERSHRRKGKKDVPGQTEGGSVTIIVLIQSASQKGTGKEFYTLQDFEDADFNDKVLGRIENLESSGIKIDDTVLSKLGISAPGSQHLGFGVGMEWQMEIDQLISLVDAHVDLRQTRGTEGMVPPVDAGNSVTRVGMSLVGGGKTIAESAELDGRGVRELNRGIRQQLCFFNDPTRGDDDRVRAANFKAILNQPAPRPLSVADTVLLLYAADKELLAEPIKSKGHAGLSDLLPHILEYVKSKDGDLMSGIAETGQLALKDMPRAATLIEEAIKSAP